MFKVVVRLRKKIREIYFLRFQGIFSFLKIMNKKEFLLELIFPANQAC